MATTLEIIRGIAQAAANAYDGSHEGSLNADERPRKVGLKREEGHVINDRRVADGFKIQFNGPLLRVIYNSEIRLQDVTQKGFEGEIVRMLASIASFLKKEYKKVTGDTLTLTKQGEPDIFVQKLSNYRTDVRGMCDYKIGGLEGIEIVEGSSEDRLDAAVRAWLSLGPGGKRPKNDTRKGS